jgi:hypothetical protein
MQFSKFIQTQSTVILLQSDTHIEHRSKTSPLYDKEKYKEIAPDAVEQLFGF